MSGTSIGTETGDFGKNMRFQQVGNSQIFVQVAVEVRKDEGASSLRPLESRSGIFHGVSAVVRQRRRQRNCTLLGQSHALYL